MVEACAREFRLKTIVQELAARLPPALREASDVTAMLEASGGARQLTLAVLEYRAAADEAGLGKGFDFSTATVANRWAAGYAAVLEMLQRLKDEVPGRSPAPGLIVHEVAT